MKRLLILFLVIFGLVNFSFAQESGTMKKAVMVISHEGFRDEELLHTKQALERNAINVKVASTDLSEAEGSLGARIKPDILFSNINMADFDAIIFVGGPGGVSYWDDPLAHKLLKEADSSGKIIGGICSASVTLAKSGILKNKRATVFPGDSQELIDNQVNYTAKDVERDGFIITANGPAAAKAFGEEIANALGK